MAMNTDNVWTALAVFGHARISIDEIYATVFDCNVAAEVAQRWIRNQLNSEANVEGVSLRINTLDDGRLDVYLQKFN
jgi:hypothetical protein